MNKRARFLILLKVLLSVLVPYVFTFKLHVEVMVNNLNLFREIGSAYLYPLGCISLTLIVLGSLLYLFILSKYEKNNIKLQNIKSGFFILDIVLILITAGVFIYISRDLPSFIQFNLLNCHAFITLIYGLVYVIFTLLTLRLLSK